MDAKSEKKNPSKTPDSLATRRGNNEGHISGISALNTRLSKYKIAKIRSSDMADYIMVNRGSDRKSVGNISSQKMGVMSSRLRDCGSYLKFNYYIKSDRACLSEAYFCKNTLLCPFCAIRRASKYMAEYLNRFEYIMAKHPNLIPYFVTHTIKDGEDLGDRFSHLKKGHLKMRYRARDFVRGKGLKTEFNKCLASVTAFESIIGKNSGEWHCHTHSIWLCEEPIDKFQLSREWESITGDSFIVDVKEFYGDVVDSFKEVFKYQLKFSSLALDQNWHAFMTLRGKRMLESTGLFRGVEIPECLTDDLLDEDYIELFYQYLPSIGYTLTERKISETKERKTL